MVDAPTSLGASTIITDSQSFLSLFFQKSLTFFLFRDTINREKDYATKDWDKLPLDDTSKNNEECFDMKCTRCGKKMNEKAMECKYCGCKILKVKLAPDPAKKKGLFKKKDTSPHSITYVTCDE